MEKKGTHGGEGGIRTRDHGAAKNAPPLENSPPLNGQTVGNTGPLPNRPVCGAVSPGGTYACDRPPHEMPVHWSEQAPIWWTDARPADVFPGRPRFCAAVVDHCELEGDRGGVPCVGGCALAGMVPDQRGAAPDPAPYESPKLTELGKPSEMSASQLMRLAAGLLEAFAWGKPVALELRRTADAADVLGRLLAKTKEGGAL